MGEMRRVTAEVDTDTAAAIDRAVASGDYGAEADVLAQALSLWQHTREAKLTELRRLIAEGLASGEALPGNFDPEDIKRRGREWLAFGR